MTINKQSKVLEPPKKKVLFIPNVIARIEKRIIVKSIKELEERISNH